LDHGANDNSEGTGTGGEPVIAVSAPAGVAVATPRSIALAASEHIDSVAQQRQHLTAGQSIVLNAGQDVGLFAQSGDLRHIAHQGEVLMQAQHNGIRIQADQSVEVSASQQHITVAAKEHITLLVGGIYFKLSGGNIEFGMPGNFIVKAATHNLTGAGQSIHQFPSWPNHKHWIGLHYLNAETSEGMAGTGYEIRFLDGQVLSGVLDADGKARHEALDYKPVEQVTYQPRPGDDEKPHTELETLLASIESSAGGTKR
ncbi:DUF2345 domain-containing protein, partial [Phytopseudomonas dryadis]